MDSTHYDTIVIGGGPAGCSAAMTLRAAGLNVALVANIARTPRFGQTVTSETLAKLTQLGLATTMDAHRAYPGVVSFWGGVCDEPAEPRAGWILDRGRFDRDLQSAARSAGLSVIAPGRVFDLRRERTHWSVSIRSAAGTAVVETPMIVDAGGRESIIGRRMRLHRRIIDKLVAMWWVVARDVVISEPFAIVESAPDAWWFTCAEPDHTRVFVRYSDGDLAGRRSQSLADALHATVGIRRVLRAGKQLTVAPAGLVSANTTISSLLAGDGWVVVGDAAFTVDPLSSQGVGIAVDLGIAAARCIVDGVTTSVYAQQARSYFSAYLAARSRYYEAEHRWHDHPFWMRRYRVKGDNDARPTVSA
jgi:flavin-dependent dehydrogenase